MIDRQLTPHFSLYQLTRTDHADLQEANRSVTPEEERKLLALAELLEVVEVVAGCRISVLSGKRCLELNRRVGGSDRSQHLKCEAGDIVPENDHSEQAVADLWQKIATAARMGHIKFGQLIFESAPGRDGKARQWVHVSQGAPYRDASRCGEVLTMKDGKYTMISRII